MGTAAYHRGTVKIRRDIDELIGAINAAHSPVAARTPQEAALIHALDDLRTELAATQAELATAKRYLELRIAERDIEREERKAAERDAQIAHERAMAEWRAAQQYQHQWRKASAYLRMFTPEQVQEARTAARLCYPELWQEAPGA